MEEYRPEMLRMAIRPSCFGLDNIIVSHTTMLMQRVGVCVVFCLVYSTHLRIISEQRAQFRTSSPNPLPKHLSRHRIFRGRIGNSPTQLAPQFRGT